MPQPRMFIGVVTELPRRRRAIVRLFDLFCLVLIGGGWLAAAVFLILEFHHV